MMIYPTCFRTAAVDAFSAYERTGTLPILISYLSLILINFLQLHWDLADPILSAGLRPFQSRFQSPLRTTRLTQQPLRKSSSPASPEKTFQERVQEVKSAFADPYPRLAADTRSLSCHEFRTRYSELADNESVEETVIISGRFSPVSGLYPCT